MTFWDSALFAFTQRTLRLRFNSVNSPFAGESLEDFSAENPGSQLSPAKKISWHVTLHLTTDWRSHRWDDIIQIKQMQYNILISELQRQSTLTSLHVSFVTLAQTQASSVSPRIFSLFGKLIGCSFLLQIYERLTGVGFLKRPRD